MHKKKLTAIFMVSLFFSSALFSTHGAKKEKSAVIAWLEGNQNRLFELSDRIWEYAETALMETRSSEALISFLEKEGFSVEKGAAGLPTAFVASWGKGEPVVGILAEYDALPGISQKISPVKEPLHPGAPGHGCGHNLFGAASTGAAVALRHVMEQSRISGTVKLFGCPAEETLEGKTLMAKAGVFNGLTAAIAWHPGDKNQVNTGSSQAMNNFKVSFFGQTAHAAGDPWNGRSSLDAVELLNIGINYLREHIPPSSRIHYVITRGGGAPNVVPDFAEGWYYCREKDRPSVEKIYERILNIVKGAALMTGTTYKVELITGVHDTLPNLTGARAMLDNLKKAGPPSFTPDEQEFARKIQEAFGKEKKGLSSRIEPIKEKPEFSGGSTDVAEVSRITPTVQVSAACWPEDVPGHSWGIVACSGSSVGRKGMLLAAKVMAMTALDLLQDQQLIKAMWEEFRKATRGRPYKSPLT